MRKLFLALLAFAVVAFCTASSAFAKPAWADGQSRGEDLHIFLVTFGVGDDIASWFGHTALMVRDEGGLILPMFNDFIDAHTDQVQGWVRDPNYEMSGLSAPIRVWLAQ